MSDQSTEAIPEMQEGWGWFDQANEPLKAKREEQTGLTQEDYEKVFARLFNRKDGQIVMGYLAHFIMSMPGFDPNVGFENGAASGFYRSGMQDLVQHMHLMKEKGANK